MVKVDFSPWKKVVIHEVTFYDELQDLIDDHVRGAPVGTTASPLLWAGGVLFLYTSIPPYTDAIVREQLQGKIHWSNVIFAHMPEMEIEIKVSEGAIKVPIVNVENNLVLRKTARWLKEHASSLRSGD